MHVISRQSFVGTVLKSYYTQLISMSSFLSECKFDELHGYLDPNGRKTLNQDMDNAYPFMCIKVCTIHYFLTGGGVLNEVIRISQISYRGKETTGLTLEERIHRSELCSSIKVSLWFMGTSFVKVHNNDEL